MEMQHLSAEYIIFFKNTKNIFILFYFWNATYLVSYIHDKIQKPKKKKKHHFYFSKVAKFTNIVETKVAKCEHLKSLIMYALPQIGFFHEEMWIKVSMFNWLDFIDSSNTPTPQQQIKKPFWPKHKFQILKFKTMSTDEPQEQMFPKPLIPIQKQQQMIPKSFIPIQKKSKIKIKNFSWQKHNPQNHLYNSKPIKKVQNHGPTNESQEQMLPKSFIQLKTHKIK